MKFTRELRYRMIFLNYAHRLLAWLISLASSTFTIPLLLSVWIPSQVRSLVSYPEFYAGLWRELQKSSPPSSWQRTQRSLEWRSKVTILGVFIDLCTHAKTQLTVIFTHRWKRWVTWACDCHSHSHIIYFPSHVPPSGLFYNGKKDVLNESAARSS